MLANDLFGRGLAAFCQIFPSGEIDLYVDLKVLNLDGYKVRISF